MTAPTISLGTTQGEGVVPRAVLRAVADGTSLVVGDTVAVSVDDTAEVLTLAALSQQLVYRVTWPALVDEHWTEKRLEDEALADLEVMVDVEGLRIVCPPVLAWSAPTPAGLRVLTAAARVEAL